MKEADIIITPIPQADGNIKKRPALILRQMPKYKDYLVCGISSQVEQYIKNFDEIIFTTDSDFESTALKRESVKCLPLYTYIDLLMRVTTVSVETLKIIKQMEET